jgi:hypothetical protein
MKKNTIFAGLALAALSLGAAAAQPASTTVRIPAVSPYTVYVGGGFGANNALHLAFAINNIARLSDSVTVGARVNAGLGGAYATNISADALVSLPALPVTVYAGPSIGYDTGNATFLGGVWAGGVAGVTIPVYQAIGVYGEGNLRYNFNGTGLGFGARVGLNFNL